MYECTDNKHIPLMQGDDINFFTDTILILGSMNDKVCVVVKLKLYLLFGIMQ